MGCHFTASKKFMTWQAKIREQRPKNHGVIFICFCRERIQAEILEGCTTKKASNWKIIAVVWQAHTFMLKMVSLLLYLYTGKHFWRKRDNHKLFLEIYKIRPTAACFPAKSKNDLKGETNLSWKSCKSHQISPHFPHPCPSPTQDR